MKNIIICTVLVIIAFCAGVFSSGYFKKSTELNMTSVTSPIVSAIESCYAEVHMLSLVDALEWDGCTTEMRTKLLKDSCKELETLLDQMLSNT